jgi:hypothetical protein
MSCSAGRAGVALLVRALTRALVYPGYCSSPELGHSRHCEHQNQDRQAQHGRQPKPETSARPAFLVHQPPPDVVRASRHPTDTPTGDLFMTADPDHQASTDDHGSAEVAKSGETSAAMAGSSHGRVVRARRVHAHKHVCSPARVSARASRFGNEASASAAVGVRTLVPRSDSPYIVLTGWGPSLVVDTWLRGRGGS